MCGIAGFIERKSDYSHAALEDSLKRMTRSLVRRGPDGQGETVEQAAFDAVVCLGHRRLAVIDVSSAGSQPMASANGRYVIIFNGEVYNFRRLRAKLVAAGHRFRSESDTEVILSAFEEWGVYDSLPHLEGMFAMAIWDRKRLLLHLVRDRLGEKPLYYGWQNGVFLFASEMKALRQHPEWQGKIDRGSLTLYLRHNYVPTPYSIFENIFKLPAGCILTLRDPYLPTESFSPFASRDIVMGGPVPYWTAAEAAQKGILTPFSGNWEKAVSELESLLLDVVGLQMVSDVPLGAFLSGGIDSSLIVSLMQANSERRVKTFTIGFQEEGYNEAVHAKAVARHLGTEHTELYISPERAREVIPQLPLLYDEPFADSSQIPTFLVAQLSRRHVTVCLSGDGGDELFAGYNRYHWGPAIMGRIGWIPRHIRKKVASMMTSVSPKTWTDFFSLLGKLVGSGRIPSLPGDKIHKLASMLNFRDQRELYKKLVSQWVAPDGVVTNGYEPPTPLTDPACWRPQSDFSLMMMYLDTLMYLPDDILVKVDRAAMGVNLETRVPFLDHRVVDFAWRLPMAMKIWNGKSKWILRHILYRYVPQQLVERPKMGFGVPIDSWLRGPLREWAESLLDASRLKAEGFFDPLPIRQKWVEHISGHRNWQSCLWGVLMFQTWLEENGKNTEIPNEFVEKSCFQKSPEGRRTFSRAPDSC